MLTIGVVFLMLVSFQVGWCASKFQRAFLGGSPVGSSGWMNHGGYMTGQHALGTMGTGSFSQGGQMHYPISGDPSKQLENNHQALSGGNCLPTTCDCPDKKQYFPNGCYICNCHGSQTSGTGNILPTPLIISAGTSQATSKPPPGTNQTPPPLSVTNQTPPPPSKASPITLAMTGSSTTAPSGGQCASAAQLCLLNCPGGYLVDPNDCTFCVCKSNTLLTGR